jgi:hypothetical protein
MDKEKTRESNFYREFTATGAFLAGGSSPYIPGVYKNFEHDFKNFITDNRVRRINIAS